MLKKTIKFIHTLRVIFLVLIIIAFFTVIGINPVDVSKFVGSKIGRAVGVSINVSENPFNKLALQLKEKESRLAAREQELAAREQEFNKSNSQDMLVWLLIIGIGVLFVLILLNYFLDYRRKRKNYS